MDAVVEKIETSIDSERLGECLRKVLGQCEISNVKRLGSGVHGTGYLISVKKGKSKTVSYVLKAVAAEGFGHDWPSDRAAMFIQALNTYNTLPRHVKAVDVLCHHKDGSLSAIGAGDEYLLLLELADGISYFRDLDALSEKSELDALDIDRTKALAAYLADIHSVKKESRSLYLRKLRDIIGHGECLMGVLDTYPEGVLSYEEMAAIEKKAIDWRARLKDRTHRLSQVHGDFHPGNIWFKDETIDFTLLDRSRGPFGEPSDDITALAINYIFFSVKYHGTLTGPYHEALKLFFDTYVELTGDREIYEILGPFFAFRGVVVSNPLFYPDLEQKGRDKIFRFIHGVLDARRFSPERAGEYLD